MIDEFKIELHRDIQDATTQLARLNSAVEARVVIKRVKENRLKEMKETGDDLLKSLRREQDERKLVQATIEQLSRENKKMDERLMDLTDSRLQQDLRTHFQISGKTTSGDPGEKVSGFKLLISRAKSSLAERVTDSLPDTASLSNTAWFWRGVKVDFETFSDEIEEILNAEFENFRSHLSDYRLDKYWITGSNSDYQGDIDWLKKCIKNGESKIADFARQRWLQGAKKHLDKIQIEINKLINQVFYWQHRIQEINKSIETAQSKVDSHNENCEKFKQRMDLDLKESNRFSEMLDNEYLHELKSRRQNIQKNKPATQTFIELLAARQLIQSRQKLMMKIDNSSVKN